MNKGNSAKRPHSMLDAVFIMDCRGLVDPRNKPFGRVLPLEVQIKIMFWVHCFYTMDKRKKVVREIRRLPYCSLTGFPRNLGDDQWWNQTVVRIHAPRRNGCHHCHRLLDHRLSVSDFSKSHCFSCDLDTENVFFSVFQIGMMVEMSRPEPNLDRLMNEGIAFVISQFEHRFTNCSTGQRPVMIGQRKSSYNTVDKVMTRLDLIYKVMEAMDFIVLDVH